MSKPYSLHQFEVHYLIKMFSALESDRATFEKWQNLFVRFGYIEKDNLQNAQFLDDILINLKLYGREHLELCKIDKRLEASPIKTTTTGFSCGAGLVQTIYDKECQRKNICKPAHLLRPYFLEFDESRYK